MFCIRCTKQFVCSLIALCAGITCFLCGAVGKAEHFTSILMRQVIVAHVASDTIPRGVPVTALPSCFSFSRLWHVFSVPVSACFVSLFQLQTLAATYFAKCPLLMKTCVRYVCRFVFGLPGFAGSVVALAARALNKCSFLGCR